MVASEKDMQSSLKYNDVLSVTGCELTCVKNMYLDFVCEYTKETFKPVTKVFKYVESNKVNS